MAFSTHILDEVLKKQKEQSELARYEIIQKIHGLLIELQKKYLFKEAYIFGSILNSNAFTEWSDIDIAFEGLADEYFFQCMAELSRELEREVDVVQLEKSKLKDKIMRDGMQWKKKSL